MAKNDVILIDSLLQQLEASSPIADQSELFEQFVLEQVLKNYDLSTEELEFGWTDGSLDGGIDGFYVLVNGRLLTDPSDFAWPRSGAEIQVYLVTCKHHSTFQQAPLDSLLASVQELFDLSYSSSELTGKYSPAIKKCRETFVAAFRQLSLYRPTLSFRIVYASRGDTSLLGASIAARAKQLTDLLTSYFSASSATFEPLGASELVELYREVKSFALDLPVQECLTAGQEGYVVLAKLTDYCLFVRDDKGQLRRYLFDSNVRAYLGTNLVNADIAQTLSGSAGPNFWWLNNGVTILATSASLVGKTLKLKDIQIVNGLQTTESIHRHFQSTAQPLQDTRSLLVKVIVSQEESIRDQVIRATNNQSTVEPAALHATDRIQRDIEEILLRHDWYYERRTNFFKNEGRPQARILSPTLVASGSVALLLKNPLRSSKLRQKHLRTEEAYQNVFSETFPIDAWPVVAALIRGAEFAIIRFRPSKRRASGKSISAWRGVLAYVAAVRLLGSFSYQLKDLALLDPSKISDDLMNECWAEIVKAVGPVGSAKIKAGQLQTICDTMLADWRIEGKPTDGRRDIFSMQSAQYYRYDLTEELLGAVFAELPPQPWNPGIHAIVAKTLGVRIPHVRKAIKELIVRGICNQQRDGVVFDQAGNEIMRDESRAPRT